MEITWSSNVKGNVRIIIIIIIIFLDIPKKKRMNLQNPRSISFSSFYFHQICATIEKIEDRITKRSLRGMFEARQTSYPAEVEFINEFFAWLKAACPSSSSPLLREKSIDQLTYIAAHR